MLGACLGPGQLLHRAVGLIAGFVRVGKAPSAKVTTAAAVLCVKARRNEECEGKGKQKNRSGGAWQILPLTSNLLRLDVDWQLGVG